MIAAFKTHIEKFVSLTEDEFTDTMGYFKQATLKKKATDLEAGHVCNAHYFVLNGCLRKFFINDKGVEQTTEFAIEHWWLTDNIAFERQSITEFYIQAVEPTEVLYLDSASQERLLHNIPKMERYFRFVYQRAFAASQMRIKYLYGFSKEEFYHHLNDTHPEFVQRIPQYLIASFLGFTPEYLSEIRAKGRS